MIAGALFVLAMGTLTAAELLAGRSASDATSGRDGGAPTVFNWTGNHSDETGDRTPAPATSSIPAGTEPTDAATTAPAGPDTTTTQPDPEPEQTTEAPADPTPTGETGTGETGNGGTGTGDAEQGSVEQPQQ
jgi:hypothetical protein